MFKYFKEFSGTFIIYLGFFILADFIGGHFNPIISVISYLNQVIGNSELLFYIIAQLAGCISAFKIYSIL